MDPDLRARPARNQHSSQEAQVGPARTTHVVWPLPEDSEWLQATSTLIASLNLPTPQTAPPDVTYEPPTNAAITAAVKDAAAHTAHRLHGNEPTLSGRKRARHGGPRPRTPSLDPFKQVFLQSPKYDDDRPQPARYLAAGAPVALPIAMLRSGHLHPLPTDVTPPLHARTSYCPHCNACISIFGQEPPIAELPWLQICHELMHCTAGTLYNRKPALHAFVRFLTDLCTAEPPEWVDATCLIRHYLLQCAEPDVSLILPEE